MNDLQLYYLYRSIPLAELRGPNKFSRIYPDYVVLLGRSIVHPHPHRHYEFDEFIDKLYRDKEFKDVILNKKRVSKG